MTEVKPVAIRSFTQDDKVFLETDIMGYVTHQMLDLREKVVQDALRTLGWKSPDDHERAVEALRAENRALSDDYAAMEALALEYKTRAERAEAELASALELLARMRAACGDDGTRMQDELEVYLRELRADSERYRWLRDPCSGAERVIYYCRGDFGKGLMSGSMLDEEIDAARGVK